ncbi:2cad8281-6e93-44d0-9184-7f167a408c7b [Sclerotinia trifoliorum]|uniref:2cad8281-6e93-44d0-9184-7f167a408c7b n=1 Tax=Sclerotinia trifoliorum TaxID=28548 RepID=A0A8H2ZN22_9HELO|nr:2cad8281-6e93-44d0-9184-7f167a408c7b [Sclerotinia trifoliorum]
MSLASKTLWRAGPLPKPLASIVHFRQSGNLLYQPQSRDNSTISRGKRIHIAGAHHLQTLIANALAQSANPRKNPITLMVPRNQYIQHYVDTEGKLQIIRNGVAMTVVGAVDIEVLPFEMESSVPAQTFPPAKSLRFKRLLMDTGPDEEAFSLDDLPSLLENGPILEEKKRSKKPARLPISDIKIYDLSYFLELHSLLCDPITPSRNVVTEQVAEIRPPPKESEIKAVPVTQLAKINTDPIDHLIFAERPRELISFFSNIKDRLHPSSVVMVIGNNPGLVQTLYDEVFPDVSKRPNFVECANGVYMGEAAIEGFWDSLRSVSLNVAQLSVGPLARTVDDGQSPGEVERREEEAKYLVERVLKAPTLGATPISRAVLERYKLRKLVTRSVVYPLTVAFNCMMGEIFSTEERVAEARLLFEEACAVVQAVDPVLTPQILLNNLLWAVVRAPNIRPVMLKRVDLGHDTNVDLDNGFIIKYGRGMTPTHEKYTKIVKDRATESARAIAAEKEETARAEARLRIAKEVAAKRKDEREKRLEFLDSKDIIGKSFKRLTFGEKVEAPLNVPTEAYFKTRTPIEAASVWGNLVAPPSKIVKEGDESDPSGHVERNGDDVEKASELGLDNVGSGGEEKAQT